MLKIKPANDIWRFNKRVNDSISNQLVLKLSAVSCQFINKAFYSK